MRSYHVCKRVAYPHSHRNLIVRSVSTAEGLNIVILNQTDLSIITRGSYKASKTSSILALLETGDTGDFIAVAVQQDGSGLDSSITTYLTDICGASSDLATLSSCEC
jgi:hypothetical protein